MMFSLFRKSKTQKKSDALVDNIVDRIHSGYFKGQFGSLGRSTHIEDGHYRIWIPSTDACDVRISHPRRIETLTKKQQKRIQAAWNEYRVNKSEQNLHECYEELDKPLRERLEFEYYVRKRDPDIRDLYDQYQTALKMKYGEKIMPNKWLDDK